MGGSLGSLWLMAHVQVTMNTGSARIVRDKLQHLEESVAFMTNICECTTHICALHEEAHMVCSASYHAEHEVVRMSTARYR